MIGLRKIIADHTEDRVIQRIIDNGTVNTLLELMQNAQYPQLQLEATWIVTNIASGSSKQCECLVEKNVVDLFLKLVYADILHISEQALWGLGNVAGDCCAFRDLVISKGAVDCFIRII